MTDPRLVEIWPPLGLRITSGPLELRGIGEAEVLALLEVARGGIHAADAMPFYFPWTLAPAEDLPLNYVQWWAGQVATFSRDAWALDLAVLWEGEVVGCQGVRTQDFPTLRYGETGSWLGLAHQGRGIGTAMRQAWCAFLFDHLDFDFITSAAFTDNPASLRVSEKVGYTPDGLARLKRLDAPAETQRLRLQRETFVRGPAIAVTGARGVRRLIGLDA